MKICYVTTYDARDVREWSGLGAFIARMLANCGAEIDYCGPLEGKRSLAAKAQQLYCQRVAKRVHVRGREPWQLKNYARQVETHIARTNPDVIFSPGTTAVALVDCKQPIVTWTDATFASLVDFYPGYSNLCRHTLADGNAMEKSALDRSSLTLYSSDWAARSAVEKYGVPAKKVHVVPFGANVDAPTCIEQVRETARSRPADCCNLLFVASDWLRKGGDTVLKVAEKLEERGIRTELAIIGQPPPVSTNLPRGVRVLGFIDKNSAEGQARIAREFAAAHFLLLPSVAECCPVSIAEASAFGVPCVVSNVGGMSTALRDNLNGCILPLDSFADEATSYIAKMLSRHDEYIAVTESCRREYEERLNWETAGQQVQMLIRALLS